MRKWLFLLVFILLISVAAPASGGQPGIRGRVTDDQGRGLAFARVEVYRFGGGMVGVFGTDYRGEFDAGLTAPRASLWRVRAVAAGYRAVDTGWYSPYARPELVLRAEPSRGALDLAVRNKDGVPVEATVFLAGPGGEVVDETDARGGQRAWRDLAPLEYQVIVLAEGFLVKPVRATVVPGKTASVTVVLQESAVTLSGDIRDARTGKPLAGASVELVTEANARIATGRSGETGRWEVSIPEGAVGPHRLIVGAEGYRLRSTDLFGLQPGQNRDWSGGDGFALVPGAGGISGVVLDRHGNPRKDAPVYLQLKGFGEVEEARTSESGAFMFRKVAAGEELLYRVSAHWSDDWAGSEWTKVEGGMTAQVVLKPTSAFRGSAGSGTVTGVVLSPTGLPLAGARVELLRPGQSDQTAVTDELGAFVMRNLLATAGDWSAYAPYTVRVSKEGYVSSREVTSSSVAATEVHLQDKGQVSLVSVLRPWAESVRGRVLDSDGQGVGRSVVTTQGQAVTTDGEGWYQVSLAAGQSDAGRTVTVAADGMWPVVIPGSELSAGAAPRTISLTRKSAQVSGKVLDAQGVGQEGVLVEVFGSGGLLYGSVMTNSAGEYRVEVPGYTGAMVIKASTRAGSVVVLAEAAGEQARVVIPARVPGN